MSRPFKIEITESEKEFKKRSQTAMLGNQKELHEYPKLNGNYFQEFLD